MRLTKDQYIIKNIEMSVKNTKIILSSIDKNLEEIKKITSNIHNVKTKQEAMSCLVQIRDISMESVIEKCNMLKASIDRYTIPYEDVQVPKEIKYTKLHGAVHQPSPVDPASNPRFRDKISKTNMPPTLQSACIEDSGDDYD